MPRKRKIPKTINYTDNRVNVTNTERECVYKLGGKKQIEPNTVNSTNSMNIYKNNNYDIMKVKHEFNRDIYMKLANKYGVVNKQ